MSTEGPTKTANDFGPPYSVREIEAAASQSADPYHADLLMWAATEIRRLGGEGVTETAVLDIAASPFGTLLFNLFTQRRDAPHRFLFSRRRRIVNAMIAAMLSEEVRCTSD
jgi:hypothetical protein